VPDWISKHDVLASMADWQRTPTPKPGKCSDDSTVEEEQLTGFISVKAKVSAKGSRLIPQKPVASSVQHPSVVKLPPNYTQKAHGLTLKYFSENGTLLDYCFRGSDDLSLCKRLIAQGLHTFPPGTYAVVCNTNSETIIYSERPHASNAGNAEPPN
jgi:hypothetical protein